MKTTTVSLKQLKIKELTSFLAVSTMVYRDYLKHCNSEFGLFSFSQLKLKPFFNRLFQTNLKP